MSIVNDKSNESRSAVFCFVGNVMVFFLVIYASEKLFSQSMHIMIYCREIVCMYLMLKYIL